MTGMLISPAVETHFLQLRKEEMARAATKKDSWHNNNNINIINNSNSNSRRITSGAISYNWWQNHSRS
jgi:hypothetical protein